MKNKKKKDSDYSEYGSSSKKRKKSKNSKSSKSTKSSKKKTKKSTTTTTTTTTATSNSTTKNHHPNNEITAISSSPEFLCQDTIISCVIPASTSTKIISKKEEKRERTPSLSPIKESHGIPLPPLPSFSLSPPKNRRERTPSLSPQKIEKLESSQESINDKDKPLITKKSLSLTTIPSSSLSTSSSPPPPLSSSSSSQSHNKLKSKSSITTTTTKKLNKKPSLNHTKLTTPPPPSSHPLPLSRKPLSSPKLRKTKLPLSEASTTTNTIKVASPNKSPPPNAHSSDKSKTLKNSIHTHITSTVISRPPRIGLSRRMPIKPLHSYLHQK